MRDDVCHFVKHQIAGGSNSGKVWRCCHVPNTGSYFYLSLDNNVLSTVTLSLKQREKNKTKQKVLAFSSQDMLQFRWLTCILKSCRRLLPNCITNLLRYHFQLSHKMLLQAESNEIRYEPMRILANFFVCRDKLFNSFS